MEWLDKLLTPGVLSAIAVIVCAIASVMIVFALILRERISGVSVSRSGLQMHTNDIPVWSEIMEKIERIDAGTCRSVRKGTTRLRILDPGKYKIPAEGMLVVYEANLPLIYAAYENHHTRKLDKNGIDNYIADMVYDVKAVLRIWQRKFPELTDELIKEYVYRWIKQVVVPNLRSACTEKLVYYKAQTERDEVSKPLKEIMKRCIRKNEHYIVCIEELSELSDVKVISTIIQPTL
jgi:hypothetical protein